MPRKPVQRDEKAEERAKKKLLKFLAKAFKVEPGWTSYVEEWSPGPWGFRLSEIGTVLIAGGAGSTHFRSEAGNELLFLRCEELFYEWAYHIGGPGDADELQQWILSWLAGGERKWRSRKK